MQEQRKLQRFDLALASSIEILDAMQVMAKDPESCMTRDVSSGGAFFLTSHPLSTGTMVKVSMLLRPDTPSQGSGCGQMQATGYVVRTEPTGMAVCFNKRCRIVPPFGN
jgi:hypothetical protein